MRGCGLGVPEKLADDRQPHGRTRTDASERMAQVVKPHSFEPGGLADSGPRLFQIGLRLSGLFARDNVRVTFNAWQTGK